MGPPAVWVDNLVLAGRRTNSGLNVFGPYRGTRGGTATGRTRHTGTGWIAFSYYLYGPASFVTARIMGVDRPMPIENTPIYADITFRGRPET